MTEANSKAPIVVAVAGNPNSGKTSVFNNLTGSRQSVGNYPGVTVEKKEGTAKLDGTEFHIIDLPGTYSLTAYSMEEVVARDFILKDKPDVVMNVIDASNLERNLYLTVQLLELDAPLAICLNMIDLCERKGIKIDDRKLASLLNIPVVPTVGHKGTGLEKLLQAFATMPKQEKGSREKLVSYGHEVENEIQALTEVFAKEKKLCQKYSPRWLAIKVLEKDEVIQKEIFEGAADAESIRIAVDASVNRIEDHYNESSETIIAERRYGFAAGLIRECVHLTGAARQDITEKIDAVVCNRFLGPIILAGVVYLLFICVFKVAQEWEWIYGKSPTGWVEALFEKLAAMTKGLEAGYPILHSLVSDGIIGGVGGVMTFVPLIFTMFMFVAILEDTGYIARIAFILDKVLKAFGLQGKSILAMIVAGGLGGGGCAVPGVMATRTLREEKDRLITILVVPFMNCGAKMPVYLMLIAAFFAARKAEMLFTLWALSWAFSLTAAYFLRRFLIKGEQTPFVMELPAYHVPTFKGVMIHTWERTWMYMKKAGTIILAINVLIWAAMYFPRLSDEDLKGKNEEETAAAQLANSLAGRLGRTLEPISKLAGFDWKTNIALIGGFAAKEVVVGTLGTAYSMGKVESAEAEPLSKKLASDPNWSPLKALVLMIFVMLYAPCFVTITVIWRETGSWRWALFSTAYTTTIAFIVAVLIFQIGRVL